LGLLVLEYNQLLDSRKFNDITIDEVHNAIKNKNIEKYCTDNNVTYSRNATNLFSDTTIVSGFLHADKGNYLWILSDNYNNLNIAGHLFIDNF
jgi:hypothetical protein